MKYSYASLAILVAVARSQGIPNIPGCALSCFSQAVANSPCSSLTDFACQCRQPQLIAQVTPCVQAACSASDAEALRSTVQELCASAGAPLNLGDGASEPATSAATEPVTSDATAEPTEAPSEVVTSDATAEPTEVPSEVITSDATAEPTYSDEPTAITDVFPTETTLTTTPQLPGVAQPTGGVSGNVTAPVVPPFTGAANHVAVGPVGGLLALVMAVLYAL